MFFFPQFLLENKKDGLLLQSSRLDSLVTVGRWRAIRANPEFFLYRGIRYNVNVVLRIS